MILEGPAINPFEDAAYLEDPSRTEDEYNDRVTEMQQDGARWQLYIWATVSFMATGVLEGAHPTGTPWSLGYDKYKSLVEGKPGSGQNIGYYQTMSAALAEYDKRLTPLRRMNLFNNAKNIGACALGKAGANPNSINKGHLITCHKEEFDKCDELLIEPYCTDNE